MSQTANKGEWSELYVLLKLLADGQLQPGDAYLGSSDTAALKVLQVVRQDSSGPISYRLGTENISIETTAGTRQLGVAKARAWANDLLAAIQTDTGEKGAKSIPAASMWMQALGTTAIKAKSADKADIEVVLHDLQTGGAPKLGFSVKSYLGGAPTLLNASGQTNICYHLPNCDDEQLQNFNDAKSFKHAFNSLTYPVEATTASYDSSSLKTNLSMIDGHLPDLIAQLLLTSFEGSHGDHLNQICKYLETLNPLQVKLDCYPQFYAHKIKQFDV